MKKLIDILTPLGSIKEQIIADAIAQSDDKDDQIAYVRDVAMNGCSGGSCCNLIYYVDTHAFYVKYAEEIDEILAEYEESTGTNILSTADTHGDLRNYLAWLAYEVKAQEIMDELEN